MGATRGTGERIAQVFVAKGTKVVAAGRREEEGETLAARCGPVPSFLGVDVTQEADVAALIAHA